MIKKIFLTSAILSLSFFAYANDPSPTENILDGNDHYSFEISSKNYKVKVFATDVGSLVPIHYASIAVNSTPTCSVALSEASLDLSVMPLGNTDKQGELHKFLVIANSEKTKGEENSVYTQEYTEDLCNVFNDYKQSSVWLSGLSLKVGEQKSIKLPDGNEFYIKLVSFNK